jgi:hypothetical protein
MPGSAPILRHTALAIGLALSVAGCFGGPGNVFSLDVGDCFDDPTPESSEVTDVELVGCDSPHDNEVYATFELPDTDFPGPDEVFETALAGCAERFEDLIGAPVGEGDLDATLLAPTEQSWTSRDDREVICYLVDASGAKLEGSVLDQIE